MNHESESIHKQVEIATGKDQTDDNHGLWQANRIKERSYQALKIWAGYQIEESPNVMVFAQYSKMHYSKTW